jgi:hypothetical protein
VVTPEKFLRGNPKMQTLQRRGNSDKVTNLGRVGRLERVKPIFLVENSEEQLFARAGEKLKRGSGIS